MRSPRGRTDFSAGGPSIAYIGVDMSRFSHRRPPVISWVPIFSHPGFTARLQNARATAPPGRQPSGPLLLGEAAVIAGQNVDHLPERAFLTRIAQTPRPIHAPIVRGPGAPSWSQSGIFQPDDDRSPFHPIWGPITSPNTSTRQTQAQPTFRQLGGPRSPSPSPAAG